MDVNLPEAFSFLFTPSRYKIAWGGRGSGKCFEAGTKILMYDGTLKSVEDIKLDDLVMGPDSKPRVVLNTHSGYGKLYKIHQTSGIDYVTNGEHILSLKKSDSCKNDKCLMPSGNYRRPNGRYPSYNDVTNISVLDFINKSKRWQDNFRGYKAGLINFEERDVLIDSYFLGVWLGDGTSANLGITTMDNEIVDCINTFASKYDLNVSKYSKENNKSSTYVLVKKSGVYKNKFWQCFKFYNLPKNKHIPQDYISNTEEIRLNLLAGLLDTDGYLSPGGYYSIVQKNHRLANEIKLVADTLGFRTSITKKIAVCCNNGVKSTVYNVSICGDIDRIPCRLKRKISTQLKPNKDKMLSQVSVSEHCFGKYYGFEVDGDHLFCLSDGTVVHNSYAYATALLILGIKKKHKILAVREYMNSISDSVKSLLDRRIEELGLGWFYSSTNSTITALNGTEFIFAGIAQNPTKIKSTDGVTICWWEEGQTASQKSIDILIPTIRELDSEIWISMNTDMDHDPMYKAFIAEQRPDAIVKKINYDSNPFFPEVLKDEMEWCKLNNYEKYLNIWMGEPNRLSDSLVFKNWYIGEVDIPTDNQYYYGMDWGYSTDPTAIVKFWVDDVKRILYICDEGYEYHVEIDNLPAFIDKIPGAKDNYILADNSRPETISHLNKRGYYIKGAAKGPGSIMEGVEFIQNYQVCIAPHCKNTQYEFSHYSYEVDQKTGLIKPKQPLDKDNHLIDSIRYGLTLHRRNDKEFKITAIG